MGRRGIALFILNLGTGWRWVGNNTPRPLYHREKNPVPIENRRLGAAPEPVWTLYRRHTPPVLAGTRTKIRPAPLRTPANVPAAGVPRVANLLLIAKSRSEPIGTAAVGPRVTSAAAAVLYRQMFFTCLFLWQCCAVCAHASLVP